MSAMVKILTLTNVIGQETKGDCFASRARRVFVRIQNRINRVNIWMSHTELSNVHSFTLESIMRSQLLSIQLAGTRFFALLAAMQIAAIAVAAQSPSPMPSDNPFLVESALPYHLPPFDKIKDEHFVPGDAPLH